MSDRPASYGSTGTLEIVEEDVILSREVLATLNSLNARYLPFGDSVELVGVEELHEAQEEITQLKKKIEELEAEQAHLTGFEPELGGDRKVGLNASRQ